MWRTVHAPLYSAIQWWGTPRLPSSLYQRSEAVCSTRYCKPQNYNYNSHNCYCIHDMYRWTTTYTVRDSSRGTVCLQLHCTEVHACTSVQCNTVMREASEAVYSTRFCKLSYSLVYSALSCRIDQLWHSYKYNCIFSLSWKGRTLCSQRWHNVLSGASSMNDLSWFGK